MMLANVDVPSVLHHGGDGAWRTQFGHGRAFQFIDSSSDVRGQRDFVSVVDTNTLEKECVSLFGLPTSKSAADYISTMSTSQR